MSSSAAHYDRITAAWRLIMGEAFHYGVFEPDEAAADALDRATTRLNERMLEALGPVEPDTHVLDVGCGIGGPARWLARETGARVTGLSNSPTGIETARSLSSGADASGLTFVVGDALHNGQPDDAFDVIWVMESSHLLKDKAGLLAECARVLRPDGRLVLCDLLMHRVFEPLELFRATRDLQRLDRAFGRARIEPVEVYTAAMRSAGLDDVRFTDISAETRPTFDAWTTRLERSQATCEALLGADGVADFASACEILAGFWDSGRMGYGIISARKAPPTSGVSPTSPWREPADDR